MRQDILPLWFRKAFRWNANQLAMLVLIIVSGFSTAQIHAQTGCALFTKSFAIDESKFYTGNGLVNVFGDFTAYSRIGKRLAKVKVTLVDATNSLVCKQCDTTWRTTSALIINGSLTPNPNNTASPEGRIQNGFNRNGYNDVYEKGSKFSDYSISWGSLDTASRNPIMNENPFALDMNIQFDSPTDSMYSNIRFSLNYEFTDIDGNRCDTTIGYAVSTVYVEAPFNSVYIEQPVQGVKVKSGSNPPSAVKNLIVLNPLENSDNKFMMKFAWRISDMKIDQMVIDNTILGDPKLYVTKAVVMKNNIAVDYIPDSTGKITIPVDDLKLSPWDRKIDTNTFGTFATEFQCEKWTAETPDALNSTISFQYTPNHVSKKTFSTLYENYRIIRSSKIGDKGLSENTTDPKPKDIKAFMLSFVNDNPTYSSVYSIDIIPTDKSVKILGIGNVKTSDNTNNGIKAIMAVPPPDDPSGCVNPCWFRTRLSPLSSPPVVQVSYGLNKPSSWLENPPYPLPTSTYPYGPALFDPCNCDLGDVIKEGPGRWGWCGTELNISSEIRADLLTDFIRNLVETDPAESDPAIPDVLNPSFKFIGTPTVRPAMLGQKNPPMILFISNAGLEVPLEFAARDFKGKIVSKGRITLKNVISSIDIDGGTEGLVSSISPNPANEGTTLNFSLENNARVVTVSVCDIQGSVIKSILTDSPLNAGSQAMYFDTSSLANGVYIVKIEVDGKVHTTKLNVVR